MHFSIEEFICKCGCGKNEIKQELLEKLEEIRLDYGHPIKILSGYRCKDYNNKVGGVIHSPHLNGWAADVEIFNSNQRYDLILVALTKGIRRIGIADTFVHIDIAPLPEWGQDVIWIY